MNTPLKFPLLFCCLTLVATLVHGQDSSPRYHLFNPTPKSEMREFSIDRPDVTESPMTVDAGHFQFEGDLFKWTKINDVQVTNIFNGLYKMGLTKNWDIHLGVELYNIYEDEEGNTK